MQKIPKLTQTSIPGVPSPQDNTPASQDIKGLQSTLIPRDILNNNDFAEALKECGLEEAFTTFQKELKEKEKEIKELKARSRIVKYPGTALAFQYSNQETVKKMLQEKEKGKIELILDDEKRGWELIKDGWERNKFSLDECIAWDGVIALFDEQGCPEIGFLCRWTDIYRSQGLEKHVSKRQIDFSHRDREKARKGLRKVEERRIPVATRFYWGEGKERALYGAIKKIHPLQIIETFKITKEELINLPGEIKKIIKKDPDKHLLYINLDPAVTRDLKHYFYLFDGDFYKKIREIKEPGGRMSVYHRQLYGFLVMQWGNKVEFNRPWLAQKVLGISKKRIKKHRRAVDNLILRLYRDFQKLNYLTGFAIDEPNTKGGLKDILFLNPVTLFKKEKKLLQDQEGGG